MNKNSVFHLPVSHMDRIIWVEWKEVLQKNGATRRCNPVYTREQKKTDVFDKEAAKPTIFPEYKAKCTH